MSLFYLYFCLFFFYIQAQSSGINFSSNCFEVALFSGSISRVLKSRRHSFSCRFITALSKEYLAFLFSYSNFLAQPSQLKIPVYMNLYRIIYYMQWQRIPKEKISVECVNRQTPFFQWRISGARYPGVPHFQKRMCLSPIQFDSPKSVITYCFSPVCESLIMMFSSFKSRCTILFCLRCSKPVVMSLIALTLSY